MVKPALVILCAGALLSPSASAYYHFVRYLTRSAPFVPVPQKFDVNSLPNRTVNFFVSEQGPAALAAGDTYTGMISQIRAAARVWNDIETSDLRLAFGGVADPGNSPSGPGIDVIFTDEIPPGLNAYTVLHTGDVVNSSGSPFVPINRATIMLPRNLSQRPSFGEAFQQTIVHEFGHAVGLQHSLTSSAMATEVTRATSRSKPVATDDIAGVSMLYPVAGTRIGGAITGRVTMGSEGVSMASVVALPANGFAVSAITNPDGTYRIDNIPPGQYAIYAHPLPASMQGEATPANVVLPVGPDGRPIAAGPAFETQFFPAGRVPNFIAAVTAGGSVDNVNFLVSQRRTNAPISSVQTYSFIGQTTIKPPTLNRTSGSGFLVAAGTGLFGNGSSLAPGLTISAVGGNGGSVGSPRPYEVSASYAQVDLTFNAATIDGPHHLLFNTANDLYVLPSAYQVTSKAPPAVTSVTPAVDTTGARLVAINGTNFDREATRYYFDGQPAAVRSFDEAAGRVLVSPPPAPGNHRAAVVAVNADGQSSLFVQSNPPFYTYDPADSSPFSITPNVLSAGSETMVEINGPGLNLIDGLARLGFGTNDVTVRRVWVTGPNRMLANIGISAGAATRTRAVTVVNGLQLLTLPDGLTIQAGNPRLIQVLPQVLNPLTGQMTLAAGSPAMLFTLNLPAATTAASLTLTLNDQSVSVTNFANGQITFAIPATTPSGPAVLRLRTGSDTAQPIIINVEPPPPVVIALQSAGATVDAGRSVRPGDTITVVVGGLVADAFTGVVARDTVSVTVAGSEHAATQVNSVSNQRGVYEVIFTLKDTLAAGSHPLVVTQNFRTSSPPVTLVVR